MDSWISSPADKLSTYCLFTMDVALEPTVAKVEFEPVVKVISANDGEEVEAMLCGNVNVILPDVAEPEPPATKTWFAVPVNEITPVFVTVTAPVAELTEIPVEAANEVTIPES